MTTKLASKLSDSERAELAACEQVIHEGMEGFVRVGSALLTVSDGRLYRETHSTFDEYVQDKWNLTARRAYQLCEAAEVVKELESENVKNFTQTGNESQARELAKAPAGQRAEVLAEAQSTAPNGKVTAKHIKRTIAKKSEPAFAGWHEENGVSKPPEWGIGHDGVAIESEPQSAEPKCPPVDLSPAAPKRRPSVEAVDLEAVESFRQIWVNANLPTRIAIKEMQSKN